MAGFVDIGEYYKWQKRKKDPRFTPEFLDSTRVLVVGGGSAGKRHVGNLHGLGVRHVTVVDPREDRRREVKDQFPDTRIFANEDEAYQNGSYHIAVIANPPAYHIASARKAVQNGSHVLIEKSISHTSEGVEEFLHMAKRARRTVGVGYMYRFYDTVQYIRKLLDEGVLGKVYSAQVTFSEYLPGWHPWEKPHEWYVGHKAEGGSELLDENHTVDFARWFFGDISEVSAHVARASDLTVDADDFAEIICRHTSGVVTQIHQDAFGRKPRKDMWIYGEKGTIFWDSYMGANKVEWYNGETGKTEVFQGKTSRNDAFFELIKDFLIASASGTTPLITGEDALKTLKVCEMAQIASERIEKATWRPIPGATPLHKTLVVAEIGCNHMGDFAIAKEMIKVAKEFGNADMVKFQKRNPRELLTPEEYNKPHPTPYNAYGNTYGEHREYLEFSAAQHRELKMYCENIGIEYSTSVWDLTSAKEIVELNPRVIKIPSACNLEWKMLEYLCKNFFGEIHVSLGMTSHAEEEQIVSFFEQQGRNKDLVLYACTSGYPVPFEDLSLLEIVRLKDKFGNRVKSIAFSGHHNGIAVDMAAVTFGVSYLERHFTLDRTWKGTDHAASLEPVGLRKLVRDVRHLEAALTYKAKEILDIEAEQRKKLKRLPPHTG